MKKIKVIQYGLGAMGSKMAEFVLKKEELELVAVIVKSEDKIGKDIGEVLKWNKKVGVKCYTSDYVFKNIKADVMLHAAVSYVPKVWEQIKPAVESGINVITIAEEMSYPFVKYKKLCKEIDTLAKKHKVTVLGSGINPGFAMDYFVLALTGIVHSVNKIKVTRLINFAPFGQAIQNNIGIGLTVSEFKKGVANKLLPVHIGLPECIYMLSNSLKWNIDKIIETKEPVITKKFLKVPGYKSIPAGHVSGFNQRAIAYSKGKEKIVLEELGRVDQKLDYKNTVYLYGYPNIIESMNVPSGDLTTTSHAVNLIPAVLNSKPGLLTMLDISLTPCLKNK